MIDREQQRLWVKSCGDVSMFYVIDWNTRVAYFEVRRHNKICQHKTVGGADEAFRLLCDMERSAE